MDLVERPLNYNGIGLCVILRFLQAYHFGTIVYNSKTWLGLLLITEKH